MHVHRTGVPSNPGLGSGPSAICGEVLTSESSAGETIGDVGERSCSSGSVSGVGRGWVDMVVAEKAVEVGFQRFLR